MTPAINAEDGVSATFKVIVTAKEPEPVSVDKSKLQAAVDEAGRLDEKDYTADSWKAFAGQLESAKKVLADGSATQADMDAAAKALKSAQSGLVKAGSGSTGGSTSGGSSTGNTGNSGSLMTRVPPPPVRRTATTPPTVTSPGWSLRVQALLWLPALQHFWLWQVL